MKINTSIKTMHQPDKVILYIAVMIMLSLPVISAQSANRLDYYHNGTSAHGDLYMYEYGDSDTSINGSSPINGGLISSSGWGYAGASPTYSNTAKHSGNVSIITTDIAVKRPVYAMANSTWEGNLFYRFYPTSASSITIYFSGTDGDYLNLFLRSGSSANWRYGVNAGGPGADCDDNVIPYILNGWNNVTINGTNEHKEVWINNKLCHNEMPITGFNNIYWSDETGSSTAYIDDIYITVDKNIPQEAGADITPPSFSNLKNSGNTTYIYYNMSFNVSISDLNPDAYLLYWNYSDPAYSIAASGTYTTSANVNMNLNRTFEDKFICFYFYANDTLGNNAVSETQCFMAKNNLSIVPKLLYPNYHVIPGFTIQEQQSFFVALNNSKNLIQQTTLCNFSSLNISAHLNTISADNVSLNTTNTYHSMLMSEQAQSPTTLNYDILDISMCSVGSAVSADVYINTTLFYNIPAAIIPPCSSGSYHQDIAQFSTYKDKANYIINITCNGCVAGKALKLIRNNVSEIINFNRFMQNHTESLVYNSTLSLNTFLTHQYRYETNKTNLMSFSCTDVNYNQSIVTTSKEFSFSFISINGIPFINNTRYEADSSYTFLFEVSGAFPENFYFNLTNSSQQVLYSAGTESYVLNKSYLPYDGRYYVIAWAEDQNGLIGQKVFSFNISDTTVPSINFNFPSKFNISTGYQFDTYTSGIELYDINLYGFNYTISYNDLQQYSTEVTGITSSSYNIAIPFQYNFTGNYLHTVYACDSHTSQMIGDFSVSKDQNTLSFDGINITSSQAIDTFTLKSADRYSFKFTYPEALPSYEYIIRSESPITYLPISPYPGHFVVWKEKKWIDFNGTSEKPLIRKISDYEYKVTFQTQIIGKDSAVSFNSIGGLNCFSAAANISISVKPTTIYNDAIINGTQWFNTEAINTRTTSGVLLYFFALALLVCLVIISEISKILVFYILTGIFGIVFSILIFTTLSALFGFITVIISVMYIVRGFY